MGCLIPGPFFSFCFLSTIKETADPGHTSATMTFCLVTGPEVRSSVTETGPSETLSQLNSPPQPPQSCSPSGILEQSCKGDKHNTHSVTLRSVTSEVPCLTSSHLRKAAPRESRTLSRERGAGTAHSAHMGTAASHSTRMSTETLPLTAPCGKDVPQSSSRQQLAG